ncbi:MAG: hypothetical protein ACR2P8_15310 [Myxococcota bacterium]
MSEETPRGSGEGGAPDWPDSWPVLLFLGFAALAYLVLQSGLHGPFVSDDGGYIVSNPYIRSLSMENLAALFDPTSPAQIHAVGNYAPVHLLLHALEYQIFADEVFGYHIVNLLVHALAAVLLVVLLLRSGVPGLAALIGGTLFVLHPANAQAVVWISQLKTSASLVLTFGALLALPRRPGLATVLFAVGLLTKASTAAALPTAAALAWVHGTLRRDGRWLAFWCGLFAVYAVVEFAQFHDSGWVAGPPAYADGVTQLRSIASYGARYLVMAASSWGVSAYQEPDPVVSWLEPWWLLSLPLGALLLWRLVVTLRRRQEEGAWWVFAAASWAPISQVFPFRYPMADHYLYFILPGLIGAVSLWLGGAARSLPRAAAPLALGASLVVLLLFGWHSSARARLWRSNILLEVDAVAHHPHGRLAHQHAARRASLSCDAATAVAHLRAANARGLDDFQVLQADPALAQVRDDPAFQALIAEWAGAWIERTRRASRVTQSELRTVALAHLARGEISSARQALEEALEVGGPADEIVRREIAAVRAMEGRDGEAPR